MKLGTPPLINSVSSKGRTSLLRSSALCYLDIIVLTSTKSIRFQSRISMIPILKFGAHSFKLCDEITRRHDKDVFKKSLDSRFRGNDKKKIDARSSLWLWKLVSNLEAGGSKLDSRSTINDTRFTLPASTPKNEFRTPSFGFYRDELTQRQQKRKER
jgi:hypothetical protein